MFYARCDGGGAVVVAAPSDIVRGNWFVSASHWHLWSGDCSHL